MTETEKAIFSDSSIRNLLCASLFLKISDNNIDVTRRYILKIMGADSKQGITLNLDYLTGQKNCNILALQCIEH